MRWRYLMAAVLVLGIHGSAALQAATPIDPAQFDKLTRLIKPTAEENKWLEIPWMTDLWEARQRAAADGKPILLWSMNGNPLACG
jgi:hypothetical protein